MAIAVGAYHSLALRSNGTLIARGQNTSGQTNIPTGLGLTNVIAIAAAANYNFALKSMGQLWAGVARTLHSPPPCGLTPDRILVRVIFGHPADGGW